MSLSGSNSNVAEEDSDNNTNTDNQNQMLIHHNDSIDIGVPAFFYFKLNTNELIDESQLNDLDKIAELAKDPNLLVTITGAADKATGNKKINRGLSRERARYIAEELIKRGIDKSQMKVCSLGGINRYSPNEANRNTCVIVQRLK